MKKLLLSLLLLPSLAFGTITVPDQAFLNATNLLKNGGFENGLANWTSSGGSFSLVTGSGIGFGNKGGSWDSSGAGQTLTSTPYVVVSDSGHSKADGVATCIMRCTSGTCTHKLQAYGAGGLLAETPIASSTSNWLRTAVNFKFPTSGNISLRIASVAANEATLYIDGCYLGRGDGINLYTGPVVTNWVSYTPVFTGWGTPTGVFFQSRRVGDSLEVRGNFIAGSTTATEARITFGYAGVEGNVTSSLSINTTESAGHILIDYTGIGWGVLNKPGVTYNSFSRDSLGVLTPMNGDNVSVGKVVSYTAKIPIQGWGGTQDIYKPDASSKMWSGTHDQNCNFARTSATFGDPTGDASCTFAESLNLNFGTVTSFQESGNNGAGIVFQADGGDRYFACATTHLTLSGGSNEGNVQLADGNNTELSSAESFTSAAGHVIPATVCGILNVTTAGSQTLKLRTRVGAGTISLATNASKTISWSIFKANQTFPSPVIMNSVVTPLPAVTNIVSGQVNCGVGNAINRGITTGLASISNPGGTAGDCIITFTAGSFSDVPVCTGTVYDGASIGRMATKFGSESSSQVEFRTTDAAGSPLNSFLEIICIGPK